MPSAGVIVIPAVVPLVVPADVAAAPLALKSCSSVPTAVAPVWVCVTATAWAITLIRASFVVAVLTVVPAAVPPAAVVVVSVV